jgi:hypothetical protein
LEAVEKIKIELKPRLDELRKANKLVEAQRLEQRTQFDVEMMVEIGYCSGIENYSRHLSNRKAGEPPPTLFDYLPPNALLVVDESHIIKSATANISKAMYQIGQIAPHRIILTGTVNPHSPLDCYGQWRFLAPWTFSDQASEPFVKTPLTMTRKQAASIRPSSSAAIAKENEIEKPT